MPGMDAPLDGYGLCPDSRILASKDVETEPGGRWNAIILLISDDLEQLCRAIAALRRDDAELGHMLADCGSVVGIVFAALNVGLYVARRHQPHRVAEPLKSAAPVMCARTCLNADEAGGQRREELQQLRSANAFADHYRAASVHSVNLKNRLRDIETDRANLAHGRLPSSGAFRRNHPMAP